MIHYKIYKDSLFWKILMGLNEEYYNFKSKMDKLLIKSKYAK